MKLGLSIIIATYNSEKTLEKTLKTLLNQTYQNFEVIIVDGLSKDNTILIIKEYENKFKHLNIPYYWSSEKDSGIYDAWNKGLTKVNSNWIAFLGSDDIYYPDALETYANEIQKQSNINYVSSKVELINEENKVLKIIGKPFNFNQMIRYMNIAHVGSFHHKSLFDNFGNFNTSYKIVGDYDFFLRCGKNINAGYINKITAKMLNSGVSNNVKKVLHETLKTQLNNKLRCCSLICYLEYYLSHLKAIFRKIYFLITVRKSYKKH